MTPAGRRDTRIELQRQAIGRNDWNEDVGAWATFAQAMASVSYGRADERRTAAMEQGVEVATFTIPDTPSTRQLQPRNRVLAKGRAWDVASVVPIERRELAITATIGEQAG